LSPLQALIRQLIEAEGPLSVARYMALALHHPQHGYYRKADPIGSSGDFTTAPEIGQVFGELLGLALAQTWLDQGRQPARLVELGPGRGTLMADLLRATAAVPGFREAIAVHLVEPSPVLRVLQEALLGPVATWHERLDEVPDDRPLLLLANEVMDALPVHQLEARDGAWRERLIGIDDEGRLGFLLAPGPSPLSLRLPPAGSVPEGAVTELGPQREALAAEIARRVARGGCALIVDYGEAFAGPTGDTLQAVRAHAPWPVLEAPGEADITSHVDFAALARAAEGAAVLGPVRQGVLLGRLGIDARTEGLSARARPDQREALLSARRRLTDPDGMGGLFEALALVPPWAPPPPGFEATP
jgi:NADH dehydrogenase [ubiquinone] 1 alpha subcomplex assembly factor 7